MIDRGWRRSGSYLYHPHMSKTCCPQWTIRLDAQSYQASKQQRQVANKFRRYLEHGSTSAPEPFESSNTGKKKNAGVSFDIDTFFEDCIQSSSAKHTLQIDLEAAECSKEKFDLYKRYQMAIHKDPAYKLTPSSFVNFLCDGPLMAEGTPHKTQKLGQHHQLYRIDGKLIAIGVIDILPACISSVYLIWDPDYAFLSLGKLSAIQEIALSRRLKREGMAEMNWYYMGYYIHDCQKMKYKADYSPSFLLNPYTNEFHPFDECRVLLDRFKYPNFARTAQEDSVPYSEPIVTDVRSSRPPADHQQEHEGEIENYSDESDHFQPGFIPQANISDQDLFKLKLIEGRRIVLFERSRAYSEQNEDTKDALEMIYSALGEELSHGVVFFIP